MYDTSRDRAYNGMPVSAPQSGMPQYNSTPYGQYPTMSREDEEKYRREASMRASVSGAAGTMPSSGADGVRDKSPKMSIGSNILNTNNGDGGLTLPPLRMADERVKMSGSPVDGTGRKVGA